MSARKDGKNHSEESEKLDCNFLSFPRRYEIYSGYFGREKEEDSDYKKEKPVFGENTILEKIGNGLVVYALVWLIFQSISV